MAHDRYKHRQTAFPGSDQWTGVLNGDQASRSTPKPSLPESHSRVNSQGPKYPMRRMNLPVNPPASYEDQSFPVIGGSPWKHYRNAFSLQLGGSVAVVCKTPATNRVFAMRRFSGPSREKKLCVLRQLKNENLLCPTEVFSFEESIYVISEYAAVSLEEIISVRPTEVQLAAIVHQILSGITYLASQNLTHGSICCPNVLLTTQGVIKIANFENCSDTTPETQLDDTKALGMIMAQLMDEDMEQSISAKGSTGAVLRLKRPMDWSEEAIQFLTLTMSSHASKLTKHVFLANSPKINELIALIALAQVSACRFYDLETSYMRRRLAVT